MADRNLPEGSDTASRIESWLATCRACAKPAAAFEQALHDMRHAGYALPLVVVAGVRAALRTEA